MAIHPDVQLRRDKELDSFVRREAKKIADNVDKMIMDGINMALHDDNPVVTVFIPLPIIALFFAG